MDFNLDREIDENLKKILPMFLTVSYNLTYGREPETTNASVHSRRRAAT